MSTKTSFKRVALVAVAALGMGVLTSVSPASASISGTSASLPFAVSVADGGASEVAAATATVSQVAGAANFVQLTTDSNGETAASSGNYQVTVSGAGATIDSNTAVTRNSGNTTATFVASLAPANAAIKVITPTVGTVTITVSNVVATGTGSYTTTALQTFTVNVTATSTGTTVASTTAIINYETVANSNALAADQAILIDSTSSTKAVVKVTVKNSLSVGFSKVLTAIVDGPGFIAWDGDSGTDVSDNDTVTAVTALGSARYDTVTTTSGGIANLAIKADGTSGTAKINIYAGTTLLVTKNVVFTGAATTLEAKAVETHIVASAGQTQDAVEVVARDASKNIATLPTISGTSDNTSALVSLIDSCEIITSAVYGTVGGYLCAVTPGASAGKATLTIKSTNTTSATVALTTSKAVIKTITLKTDKKVYSPGEKITLTLSAADDAGTPFGAKELTALLSDTSSVTTNLVGTGLTKAATTFSGGVVTTTYYAPLGGGAFTFKAVLSATSTDLDVALRGTTLSAEASVGASTEIAALTTLVNSLLTKINAMSKLINKIQKKLGVK